MALTTYVEMRAGERWHDLTGAFMRWCQQQKQLSSGGCHEGDPGGPDDGRQYAAVSIPDHSPALVGYLREWAALQGRRVG